MNDKPDEAVVGMIRCYLNQKRVSWPYLAVLFVALAIIVVAPLLLP